MHDPARILIVDDNETNRDILRTRLAAHGYDLLEAGDGEQALAVAKEHCPDLVLLDVIMPKLDGIEVCRRLKHDPAFAFMSVILVTARAGTKDVVMGLDAGADEYLTKPIDQLALVARVKSVLRLKELHDRVAAQAADLAAWNRELERRVADQVRELERVGRLKRFLAPQIAELIVSSGDERVLESHRREITVVVCDLRGFTAFSETAAPEDVMAVLREYQSGLGALVDKFEGTVERFTGDGLMVWFNDPLPCSDPCGRAARMSIEMRGCVSALAGQVAQARPRSRLCHWHGSWLRDARPDRLRAPVRLRRRRNGGESCGTAVQRSQGRPDFDRQPRARRRRRVRDHGSGRRADPQGLQPAGDGV
jgi:adenylate cyclase